MQDGWIGLPGCSVPGDRGLGSNYSSLLWSHDGSGTLTGASTLTQPISLHPGKQGMYFLL